MPVVPITLPPGLFMNGTPYEAKNRWADGNRVRWHNGSIRPIGGWEQSVASSTGEGISLIRVDNESGTPPAVYDDSVISSSMVMGAPVSALLNTTYRDGKTWVDNGGSRRYVYGSNSDLKVVQPDGTVLDITPAGFVGTANKPTLPDGYGNWFYGRGTYGTARPIDATTVATIWRWDLDTWGEDLLAGAAAPQHRGPVYVWDIDTPNDPAQIIAEAPQDQNGFVVTDQRVVMCIGSSTEARIVRWSDREDYTNWTPDATNWAGSYFLQGNGRLVSINKVLNNVLILSESDAHAAQFIGTPYIYGFNRIGDGCGPWNGQTVVVTDRFAMWPGRRTFWLYDGSLRPIPCDIMDFLATDVDFSSIATAYGYSIPQYNELVWCYKSVGGTETDSYVSYDYVEGHWQKGRLDRTCGVSGEVYVNPRMVAPDSKVYEHEVPGALVPDTFAATGPLEVGDGETNMAVRRIFPDTETFGEVSFQLVGRQMPTETDVFSPVYTFANPTQTRMLAREIRLNIFGKSRAWQVGSKTRFDVAPMGTGRR